MSKNYIKSAVSAEITEKKSRFIAYLTPVEDEAGALAFIDKIKKKHYDARHNCSAYITGDISRSSDDGEPAHTAGRPMLETLQRAELDKVCLVVTRYFGGILLGTGGLVRAYQAAAAEAVKAAELYSLSEKTLLSLSCSYTDYGKISHFAENNDCLTENVEYGADVSLSLLTPPEKAEEICSKLISLTAGAVKISGERTKVMR